MATRPARWARKGFTLVEVLVTLVLIGLLVGVVLPSVIGQLDRGEPARLTEDMESVRSAAKMFRVDVKRWPASVAQLVVPESNWGGDTFDINSAAIPPALRDRWAGPYLETGTVGADGGLSIALGATVDSAFSTTDWGGNTFIYMTVQNVTADQASAISEIIDGNTTVTTTDAGGRVRYDGSVLTYLLSPISG